MLKHVRIAAAAVCVSTLLAGAAGSASANEPPKPAEADAQAAPGAGAPNSGNAPPAGLFVWPSQPQAVPQPPPQGCTYRENKLELIV